MTKPTDPIDIARAKLVRRGPAAGRGPRMNLRALRESGGVSRRKAARAWVEESHAELRHTLALLEKENRS